MPPAPGLRRQTRSAGAMAARLRRRPGGAHARRRQPSPGASGYSQKPDKGPKKIKNYTSSRFKRPATDSNKVRPSVCPMLGCITRSG